MTRDFSLYLDPSYYFREQLLTETPAVGEPLLDVNTRVEIRLVNDIVEQQRSKFDEVAGTWISRKGYETLKQTDINEFKERIWTNNHLGRSTHYINIKGPFPAVTFEIIINSDIFFAIIGSEEGQESMYSLRDPEERKYFLASCRSILANSKHFDSLCFSELLGLFVESVVARVGYPPTIQNFIKL